MYNAESAQLPRKELPKKKVLYRSAVCSREAARRRESVGVGVRVGTSSTLPFVLNMFMDVFISSFSLMSFHAVPHSSQNKKTTKKNSLNPTLSYLTLPTLLDHMYLLFSLLTARVHFSLNLHALLLPCTLTLTLTLALKVFNAYSASFSTSTFNCVCYC